MCGRERDRESVCVWTRESVGEREQEREREVNYKGTLGVFRRDDRDRPILAHENILAD